MENVKVIDTKSNQTFPRKVRKMFRLDQGTKEDIIRVHGFVKTVRSVIDTINLDKQEIVRIQKSVGVMNIAKCVANLLNVSKDTVRNVVKEREENQENVCAQPEATLKKYSRMEKYQCDGFTISMLRRTVQSFYARGKYPDLNAILAKCKEDRNFPPISRALLYKWLIRYCKMKYRRINKKPVFLERNDIRIQRENYLREIRKYRNDGYRVFYSDETWASPDQSRNRCWQMLLTDKEYEELFNNTFQGAPLRDMNNYTGKKWTNASLRAVK